jgi:hypothetical protein
MGFGCAFRDYAFAVQSGRVSARTVNTSGTAVTLVSGPNFDTAWTGNVKINGTAYTISGSVTATTMTLTTGAGTHAGVKFTKNADTAGLDTDTLRLCQNEILDAGQNWRTFSANDSYGTSMDGAVKRSLGIGYLYHFSTDFAFGLAVNDALVNSLAPGDPAYDSGHNYSQDHGDNVTAIIENFNYQHGCNPLNEMFVTGNGWKRQRVIVDQYANYPSYDARLLPPSGVPLGNITFSTIGPSEGTSPTACDVDSIYYPAIVQSCSPITAESSFAIYDRWGDYHNVNREFSSFRTVNALCAAAYLHGLSGISSSTWSPAAGTFTFLSGTPTVNVPTVVRLDTGDSSINLDEAQITWDVEFEAQPAFGRSFTLKPRATIGDTLVEAEAVLPDGRRVFGRQYVHFRPTTWGHNVPTW